MTCRPPCAARATRSVRGRWTVPGDDRRPPSSATGADGTPPGQDPPRVPGPRPQSGGRRPGEDPPGVPGPRPQSGGGRPGASRPGTPRGESGPAVDAAGDVQRGSGTDSGTGISDPAAAG